MPIGRPPLPTTLNNRKGDPSHRRRNTTEPTPPVGSPVMPQHIADDEVARAEWQSVCGHLDSMGLLAETDARSIELFCKSYSRYREAEAKIDQFGDVFLSPNKQYPQVSPYFSVRKQYLSECKAFLVEMGLTPSARARMRQKQQQSPKGDSRCREQARKSGGNRLEMPGNRAR